MPLIHHAYMKTTISCLVNIWQLVQPSRQFFALILQRGKHLTGPVDNGSEKSYPKHLDCRSACFVTRLAVSEGICESVHLCCYIGYWIFSSTTGRSRIILLGISFIRYKKEYPSHQFRSFPSRLYVHAPYPAFGEKIDDHDQNSSLQNEPSGSGKADFF